MKIKVFFRVIFLTFMLSVSNDIYSQIYTVRKTDCNVEFVNPANNSIAYSFDLYQGCFYAETAMPQLNVSDNKRSQRFTLPQVIGYPSLDSLFSQLMNWKLDCINYHK